MKRLDFAVLLGTMVAVALSAVASFAADVDTLSHEVLRLHIVAHSDSERDQALKLQVRDRLLEETGDLFAALPSKAAAQNTLDMDVLAALAQDELQQNGCDLPVKAMLVTMPFETRVYDGYTLPAGMYDAVRIEIGDAAGKNWWCVLFPPLCVSGAMDEAQLQTVLSDPSAALITNSDQVKPRLFLWELIERWWKF